MLHTNRGIAFFHVEGKRPVYADWCLRTIHSQQLPELCSGDTNLCEVNAI